MVRPKKVRGGKRQGGRNWTGYSLLSQSKRKEYHHIGVAKFRGQNLTDLTFPAPELPHSPPSPPVEGSPVSRRGPGRPALNPEAGPMSPHSLGARRRELGRVVYKRRRISDKRREACSKRADRHGGGDGNAALDSYSEDDNDTLENDEVTTEDDKEDSNEEDNDDSNEEDNESDNGDQAKGGSSRTLRRMKARFLEIIPDSFEMKIQLLKHLVEDFDVKEILIGSTEKIVHVNVSRTSLFRYRKAATIFLEKTHRNNDIPSKDLLIFLAQQLVKTDKDRFFNHGISFLNQANIPVSIRVQRISDHLASLFLRDRSNVDSRKLSIQHAVKVVEQADLHHERGEISALATAIGSSAKFASKVLTAVSNNNTEDLFKKKTRSNSISDTDIPDRLTEFLTNAEHSRALPGNESVSVAYGRRMPKFLLKKSKIELAEAFKKENPDVTFSTRLLLREWPANFVPPSSKDQERNVCPLHSNLRRVFDGLRKVGAAGNLPKSVRAMCSLTICQDHPFDPLVPLSWPPQCALGQCAHCPDLSVDLPENRDTSVHFLQWQKGLSSKCDAKGNAREITSLFPVTLDLDSAVKKLKSFFPQMKIHVFVASQQYEALRLRSTSLKAGDLLTIEDYTMNFDIQYMETTTSSHYTANTVTFAGYPVAVRYFDPIKQELSKGAIIFISEDKLHDYQQVERMEKRTVEICEEKCGQSIKNWNRWSDNCAAQFKSKKTIGKLVQAKENVLGVTEDDPEYHRVSWDFLEANEAKNESDTIGGLSKTALRMTLMRNPDISIITADDLVENIKKGLEKCAGSSHKYSFMVVESFPKFIRATQSLELTVPGIRSKHSFTVHEGGVLASQLSCQACTVSDLCHVCKKNEPSVTSEKMQQAWAEFEKDDMEEEDSVTGDMELEGEDMEEAGEDMDNLEDNASESEDDQASSSGDEEDGSEESEDDEDDTVKLTEPGSIVWVCWGSRWYPAKVVLLTEVPEGIRNSLRRATGRSAVVKFYGDNDYGRVDIKKLDQLGVSNIDLRRSRNPGIMLKYNLALADLKYRI